MKPILLVLFIILGNSCNQEESVSPVQNQNQETVIDQGQLLGPNEIMLKINVLESSGQSKEICGLTKDFVFHVEVLEVIKIGSSVNHKFSINEKMDVSFLFEPQNLSADITLEVKAREGLCPDTSNTYFTIIEHRILE